MKNTVIKTLLSGTAALALATPASAQWALNGNAIALGNFLGTTNAQDLIIKTTNVERMMVDDGGFVRIGNTGTPEFMLSLTDRAGVMDGGILAKGTLNSGTTLATTGTGTRLIWYPRKAAFRAGEAYLTSWDDANIGQTSFAGGWNNVASGSYSTAFGAGNTASGGTSTAFGEVNEALGFSSTAFGNRARACCTVGVAIGTYVTANSDFTVAIGSGLFTGSIPNGTRMVNGVANSFGVGFKSTVPTFFVGPADNTAGSIGKVGIGTTSPGSTLHVVGSGVRNEISTDANHAFELWNSAANRRWNLYQLSSTSPISPNAFYIEYYNGGGFNGRMLIDQNGNVGIGTTTPGTTLDVNGSVRGTSAYQISDARFKTDIKPLDGALAKVMALNGVSYDWRRTEFPEINFKEGRQIGFIAQDVEKVVPEAVMQDGKGYYSVAYTEFVPLLVEAMKQQQSRIERLETALKSLGVDVENLDTPSVK